MMRQPTPVLTKTLEKRRFALEIEPLIGPGRRAGMTLQALADQLNERGFRTTTGRLWSPITVREVLWTVADLPRREALESGREGATRWAGAQVVPASDAIRQEQ